MAQREALKCITEIVFAFCLHTPIERSNHISIGRANWIQSACETFAQVACGTTLLAKDEELKGCVFLCKGEVTDCMFSGSIVQSVSALKIV